MKKFKYILISSIIIFGISFPSHFLFDIFQNDIIAALFPANESIFQHMKMVFSCFFIFYLGLWILRKRFNYHNLFLVNIVSVLSCITIFLIIYIPVYLRFGEYMIFTLILLFITILFGQYIGSLLIDRKDNKWHDTISIICIFIIFIINGYLTYNPIKNFIFWDPEHETYEIISK